jgi:hypothetical protein
VYLSAWTYPWDVARLGVDAVLGDLAHHGVNGIDLAATYHPLSAISPRGEHLSIFFSPSGGVFFPARRDRYDRIEPYVWPDASVIDVWRAVAERLPEFGLELNAWTICLFQPWMAQRYPDIARVYATGTALDTGVCASHPDVRAYLRALLGDLVDQFPIGVVKLEGIAPPRFDYGWTRRRLYATLSVAQEAALSLCFCDACCTGAAAAGVDAERARAVALETLTVSTIPHEDAAGVLAAYGQVGRDAAAALVRDLAAIAHGARSRIAVATPVDGTAVGVAIEDVIEHVDVVMLAGLPRDRSELRRVVDVMRAQPTPPSLEYFLHPPFNGPAAGALPEGIDDDLDDPHWRTQLRDALEHGVDRLSLYNYGLLTPDTFARLAAVAASSRTPTIHGS